MDGPVPDPHAPGSRAAIGIAVGTVVECWPGARPEGRSYQAITTSGLTSMGGHTPGYYVRSDEGIDFIAATHVRAVL